MSVTNQDAYISSNNTSHIPFEAANSRKNATKKGWQAPGKIAQEILKDSPKEELPALENAVVGASASAIVKTVYDVHLDTSGKDYKKDFGHVFVKVFTNEGSQQVETFCQKKIEKMLLNFCEKVGLSKDHSVIKQFCSSKSKAILKGLKKIGVDGSVDQKDLVDVIKSETYQGIKDFLYKKAELKLMKAPAMQAISNRVACLNVVKRFPTICRYGKMTFAAGSFAGIAFGMLADIAVTAAFKKYQPQEKDFERDFVPNLQGANIRQEAEVSLPRIMSNKTRSYAYLSAKFNVMIDEDKSKVEKGYEEAVEAFNKKFTPVRLDGLKVQTIKRYASQKQIPMKAEVIYGELIECRKVIAKIEEKGTVETFEELSIYRKYPDLHEADMHVEISTIAIAEAKAKQDDFLTQDQKDFRDLVLLKKTKSKPSSPEDRYFSNPSKYHEKIDDYMVKNIRSMLRSKKKPSESYQNYVDSFKLVNTIYEKGKIETIEEFVAIAKYGNYYDGEKKSLTINSDIDFSELTSHFPKLEKEEKKKAENIEDKLKGLGEYIADSLSQPENSTTTNSGYVSIALSTQMNMFEPNRPSHRTRNQSDSVTENYKRGTTQNNKPPHYEPTYKPQAQNSGIYRIGRTVPRILRRLPKI